MKKFKKIVAVDPVSIIDSGREELKNYADEIAVSYTHLESIKPLHKSLFSKSIL